MDFWRFRALSDSELTLVSGEYSLVFIAISVCIAAISAYAMLIVVERCWANYPKPPSQRWLALGAVVMGFGVWSMHFTGMLAFKMPYAMHMDWTITLLSAIPACLGAFVAVRLLAFKSFKPLEIQLGALSLALGIGTMHYLGMEGMRYDGLEMRYVLPTFLLSIILAHVFALSALYTRVWRADSTELMLARRVMSAVLIGIAVSAMHYTAMSASEFYAHKGAALVDTHAHSAFSWVIVIDVVLFVGIVVIGVVLGTRLDKANKKAASTLQRENAVISALADALLVLDDEGVITTYNVSAQRLFGGQHSPMEGKSVLELIPELGSFEALKNWDSSGLVHGKSGLSLQFAIQIPDAPTEYFEAVFSKLFFDEELHYVALVRDITARMQMEQQLRQAQKLESIGQLAAGIAHEINTPTQYVSDNMSFLKKAVGHVLQAIEMYRQIAATHTDEAGKERIEELEAMLKKAKFEYIKEEIPKSIEQSSDGLQRVTTIVRAMKSFSHASEGEFSFADLREAIESTVTICRNEWKYQAEMDIDIPTTLPAIPLILDEFNQVILNLVVNGAHAIESKREKNDDPELGRIGIKVEKAGDMVSVEVSDSGCGIPKRLQEKVFEPFFTTKAVGKGTGQGLSIVYSVIVEKHKGKVELSSIEGEGTRFRLMLPLAQASVKGDAETSEK